MKAKLAILLFLPAFLNCGYHEAIRVQKVEASAQGEQVSLSVTVETAGQIDWEESKQFCLHAEWKETAKLSHAATEPNDYYAGSPDAEVPVIAQVEQCFNQAIKVGSTVTLELTSSKQGDHTHTILVYATGAGAVYDTVARTKNP